MELDDRTIMEEKIKKVRSETPEPGDDPDEATKFLADNPGPLIVNRTITSTGVRISTQMKEQVSEEADHGHLFSGLKVESEEKGERVEGVVANKVSVTPGMSFKDFLKATNTPVMTTDEYLKSQMKESTATSVRVKEEPDVGPGNEVAQNGVKGSKDPVESADGEVKQEVAKEVVKAEFHIQTLGQLEEEFERWCEEKDRLKKEAEVEGVGSKIEVITSNGLTGRVKQEEPIEVEPITTIVPVKEEPVIDAEPINWSKAIVPVKEEAKNETMRENFMKKFNRIPARGGQSSQKPSDGKKPRTEDQKPCSIPVEDGDFPEEKDWFLVGRTMVTALSTTKGRKLADNEIVHFSFPSTDWRLNAHWIVRFSTKRYGEVCLYLGSISFLLKFPV